MVDGKLGENGWDVDCLAEGAAGLAGRRGGLNSQQKVAFAGLAAGNEGAVRLTRQFYLSSVIGFHRIDLLPESKLNN